MKVCPLCGRTYVKQELVVLPPSKDEVLAEWRARRRAAKLAAGSAVAEAQAPAETVIPAARTSSDDAQATDVGRPTWRHGPVEVAPKLLSVGAAAMFVSAFALGEGVMALNLIG